MSSLNNVITPLNNRFVSKWYFVYIILIISCIAIGKLVLGLIRVVSRLVHNIASSNAINHTKNVQLILFVGLLLAYVVH